MNYRGVRSSNSQQQMESLSGRAGRLQGPHIHPPSRWPSTVLPSAGVLKLYIRHPTLFATPYLMNSGNHYYHDLPNYRMNVPNTDDSSWVPGTETRYPEWLGGLPWFSQVTFGKRCYIVSQQVTIASFHSFPSSLFTVHYYEYMLSSLSYWHKLEYIIFGKVWNLFLEEGQNQFDRSCEKWGSTTYSQGGEENPTYNKKGRVTRQNKEVTGRRDRRRKQLLDDLKETRGYWKLKEVLALEEATDLSQDRLRNEWMNEWMISTKTNSYMARNRTADPQQEVLPRDHAIPLASYRLQRAHKLKHKWGWSGHT